MTIFVFGNKDSEEDNKVYKVIKRLSKDINSINFVLIKPNEDLPFSDEEEIVILDTVQGIDEVTELRESDLDKLVNNRTVSVHDFDLGFQLSYLKKLGKLGKVKIVGIPQTGEIDYLRIQSIFKKLVAQDMQGS